MWRRHCRSGSTRMPEDALSQSTCTISKASWLYPTDKSLVLSPSSLLKDESTLVGSVFTLNTKGRASEPCSFAVPRSLGYKTVLQKSPRIPWAVVWITSRTKGHEDFISARASRFIKRVRLTTLAVRRKLRLRRGLPNKQMHWISTLCAP